MPAREAGEANVILSTMPLTFRSVEFPPLRAFTAEVPAGAIIGVAGEQGSGTRELARLAAGLNHPMSGDVVSTGTRRYIGPLEPLDLSPADLLIIDHTLAHRDALERAQAYIAVNRLRATGTAVLLLSHESALLREWCDEIWLFDKGVVVAKGDPRQVLEEYQGRIAAKKRTLGQALALSTAASQTSMLPAMRKGDGRAQIIALETLGDTGKPTMIWRSGEQVTVRVVVRFRDDVESPVIGIMIRTRIGLEVYGTNTELEKVPLGRCVAGQTVAARFSFACHLCPKEYTLTAASHDPDGTAHDWVDDAVAFTVADSRYTAGVANLRAKVEVDATAIA